MAGARRQRHVIRRIPPGSSIGSSNTIPRDTNICSILPRCGSSTARSRAGAHSIGSRGCRSAGRSTRTSAASTAARSVTSARSSCAPTGRPTTATAARSGSRRTSPRCSRGELARPSWNGEAIAIGAATDPYQPAEGRYRLTRACLEVLGRASTPFSLITRGPLIVRDVDVLAGGRPPNEGLGHVLRADARRGGLADDRARHGAAAAAPAGSVGARRAGIEASVGMAPILPGLSDRPEQLAEVVKAARAAGATECLGEPALPPPRHPGALPRGARPRLAGGARAVRAAVRTAARISRVPRPSRCGAASASSPASTAFATAGA